MRKSRVDDLESMDMDHGEVTSDNNHKHKECARQH